MQFNLAEIFNGLAQNSGIANITWGQAVMILISCVLLYLAIGRKFEPLLLVPIAFRHAAGQPPACRDAVHGGE